MKAEKHIPSGSKRIKKSNRWKHGALAFDASPDDASLYRIWQGMKTRCNNSRRKDYKYYGGRGITYDPRYETFDNFYQDFGANFKVGLSIERVNVNANYTFDNITFIPRNEQPKNTNRVHRVIWEGKEHILSELAPKFDMTSGAIIGRMLGGMTVEQALLTPPRYAKGRRGRKRKASSPKSSPQED
jgi:hypothetical protein